MSGNIENSSTGTYDSISLVNHANHIGNIINRGVLGTGSQIGRSIQIDSFSKLTGSIRNDYDGRIEGGVGVVNGTVTGDIVNYGVINPDYNSASAAVTITDSATVTQSIINNGTINGASAGPTLSGLALEVSNGSTVGSIVNNRDINAGVRVSGSTIVGDIVNVGVINASYLSPINTGNGIALEITDGSLVNGRIENKSTITGAIVVSDGAEVTGGIVNSGGIKAISGGNGNFVALDVAGAGKPLTITNTGLISGEVRLGTSTLNLNGGTIKGAIIGDDDQHSRVFASSGGISTLNVNTDFTSEDPIQVGAVNVAANKTLTLSNNKVKGLLTVNGTLAGEGDVGPTTLTSGSTLSPGTAATSSHIMMAGMSLAPGATMVMIPSTSPTGTITVNGDLTFKPGSTYRVDATADGKSDRVTVNGTANLAGAVVHVGSGGTYAESTAYTILSATSLNGSFDTASSDMAYLQPSLSHQNNQVVLTLDRKQVSSRPIEFADLAVTSNQRSAANAVQSLPKTSSLYTRVLNLPNGAPAGVFADLSGESFGSSVSAMQNVSNNVASLPTAQLRANMNAGFVPGPPTAQVGRGDASMLPRSNAQPLWAQTFGNWRTMDGNGNVAKSRERDFGIFVGGDHGVGNGWRLGGAFGYTDSRITVDDRSAKSDVNSYSAILYGGKSFEAGSGKINFTAGVAYTWHDINSKRNINAAGQYQELKADYSASTGQVFTDVGYAIPLNDRVTLEPFFGADFSDLRTRGFSESGGDAALSGKSSTSNVGTTTLGLRAQTTFDVKNTAARLRGMLGWRHAYGDVNPEATMSFDGSQPFTVAGNPLARDAAVMEVGVDVAMSKNATLGLAYSGQFGDGNRQNTGTVNVSWRF
ncbi:autotransporter domain-containing protein [Achromobacter mucicolens]|uniref:autotransporter family protein n=1 Tax=Achromobacter mucicolens TaxID=1389922 RepID=UPI002449BA68|nr:autotransporter outer membrane beta-barrel domain-containing protein [Achromobacter mucicolens]MDH0090970.1 autotransporter domain-containing protein [Achromobacter mucicolens]